MPAARHRWRGEGGPADPRRPEAARACGAAPAARIRCRREVGALEGPPARTEGGAGTRRGKSSQRR